MILSLTLLTIEIERERTISNAFTTLNEVHSRAFKRLEQVLLRRDSIRSFGNIVKSSYHKQYVFVKTAGEDVSFVDYHSHS